MAKGMPGMWLYGRLALSAILLVTCLFGSTGAIAEKRVALLISNEAYDKAIGPLKNPHNDIALIKAALLRVGFAEEDIQVVANAGRVAMLAAFDSAAAKLHRAGPDAISFFYYSGHGAANDRRENFLIPVDVGEVTAASFWYNSVNLRELLDRLNAEAPEAKHFIVFDACRNTLRLRAPGSRALVQPKGFEPVRNVPGGMLIAFSTAEGELASDAGEQAGPYATVLADEIVRPGVEAVAVFRNTQLRVSRRTGQRPWTQSGPIGETYFAARDASQSEAARAWAWVRDTQSEAVLEEFINRFGESAEAAAAKARFAELRRQALTIRVPMTICEKPSAWVNLIGTLGRCLKPGSGETFQNCWKEGGQEICGPEMVVGPAGRFIMGSPDGEGDAEEHPAHEVEIREAFAVGRHEITVAQYTKCMNEEKCPTPEWLELGPNNVVTGTIDTYRNLGEAVVDDAYPIVGVSWNDATAYAAWLSKKTGFRYRLLSEAEWEYAARAGSQSSYSFGDTGTALADYGWSNENSGRKPHPGGKKKPNGWGLYDMHGNVWEWVQDCKADYKETPRDGSPAQTTTDCVRVFRGGSWASEARWSRSASRFGGSANTRYFNAGFRLARSL